MSATLRIERTDGTGANIKRKNFSLPDLGYHTTFNSWRDKGNSAKSPETEISITQNSGVTRVHYYPSNQNVMGNFDQNRFYPTTEDRAYVELKRGQHIRLFNGLETKIVSG